MDVYSLIVNAWFETYAASISCNIHYTADVCFYVAGNGVTSAYCGERSESEPCMGL
jgi:hypothetical protein